MSLVKCANCHHYKPVFHVVAFLRVKNGKHLTKCMSSHLCLAFWTLKIKDLEDFQTKIHSRQSFAIIHHKCKSVFFFLAKSQIPLLANLKEKINVNFRIQIQSCFDINFSLYNFQVLIFENHI